MTVRRRMPPSGSKIHRIWKCAPSAILPRDVSEEAEARSEPARGRGKDVHRYLERVRAIGRDRALAEVPKDLELLCKALDLDQLPVHLATEVAYAWNWRERTARELGRNLGHRDYHKLPNPPDPDTEIPCTLDVVGLAEVPKDDGAIRRGYVGDYKLGHTTYPRPGSFGQTLLGACCLQSVEQLDDCIVELLYLDDGGGSRPVRDLVDVWDLDFFAEQIEERLGSLDELEEEYLAGRGLPLRTGPHCQHCACLKHCDAQTALVRAVPAELLKLGIKKTAAGELEVQPGTVTVRNASVVYEAAEAVIAVMKRVQQEVIGIAFAGEPIPLSDGRVIERYKYSRRQVAGQVAAPILARKFGQEEAMTALTIETSFQEIRRLVVKHLEKGKKIETKNGDGELDKLLAEIGAAGGITVSQGIECKPHQPARGKKLDQGKQG